MKKCVFLCIFLFMLCILKVNAFDPTLPNIKQSGSAVTLNKWDSLALKYSGSTATYCTKFAKTSPAGKNISCTLNEDWGWSIRAGVASIIRQAGAISTSGNATNNYYFAELAINRFLYSQGIDKDNTRVTTPTSSRVNSVDRILSANDTCKNNANCDKTYYNWYAGAITKKQAIDTVINGISISLGTETITSDANNYYISVPITTGNSNAVVVNSSVGTASISNNTINVTIPKTSTSVTLTATAQYKEYVARNYSCGTNYQTLTPAKTEQAVVATTTTTKTITMPSLYYLDVNVLVDGVNTGAPQNYVKYNFYINNNRVGTTKMSDFYQQHPVNTQYKLTDLEIINDQYAFDGIYEDNNTNNVSTSTEKSGTIGNAAKTIWIKLKTKSNWLDVNVLVDGVNTGSPQNYVKYNFYINNNRVGTTKMSDFYQYHPINTQYKLTDLEIINDQYAFDGIYEDNNTSNVSTSTEKSGTIGNAAKTIWIKLKSKGTLEVEKVNNNGDFVRMADIKFNIYKGNNCNVAAFDSFVCKTGGSGKCEYLLPEGIYSIEEKEIQKQGPDKVYVVSNECVVVGNISSGKTTTTRYINKTQCEIDFEKDSSISNRLSLYKRYNFNNLLDFTIDKSSTACSFYEPNYNKTESCLDVDMVTRITEKDNSSKIHNFHSQDISGYNDILKAESIDDKSYCLIDFELTKGTNVNYNPNTAPIVKAGRMIFNIDKEDLVATGVLTKKCYIHTSVYNNYVGDITKENFITPSDYIQKVKLDTGDLKQTIEKSEPISTIEGEFYKVEGSAIINYKTNPVYAEKITGKTLSESECLEAGKLKNKCRILGYGVASKFIDGASSNLDLTFNFKIETGTKGIFSFNENGDVNACPYKVEPQIIEYPDSEKGELELEFRTIDTKKPFNREPKSNWAGTNKVQEEIINSNNSYNQTGKGSLYQTGTIGRIILTPDIVQQIREYNAGKGTGVCANPNPSYDDYTVHTEVAADGTEPTTTNFFKCIGLTKVQ